MDTALKIVTNLPLQKLWENNEAKTATRGQSLSEDSIRSLLRSGVVQFVVADVGAPLRWIPLQDCFAFWKGEVQLHLAGEERVILNQFPGGYCYFSSLWSDKDSTIPLIVLEKHH